MAGIFEIAVNAIDKEEEDRKESKTTVAETTETTPAQTTKATVAETTIPTTSSKNASHETPTKQPETPTKQPETPIKNPETPAKTPKTPTKKPGTINPRGTNLSIQPVDVVKSPAGSPVGPSVGSTVGSKVADVSHPPQNKDEDREHMKYFSSWGQQIQRDTPGRFFTLLFDHLSGTKITYYSRPTPKSISPWRTWLAYIAKAFFYRLFGFWGSS